MVFKESDIRPRAYRTLEETIKSLCHDARWASVPPEVEVIDRLQARVDHTRRDRENAR